MEKEKIFAIGNVGWLTYAVSHRFIRALQVYFPNVLAEKVQTTDRLGFTPSHKQFRIYVPVFQHLLRQAQRASQSAKASSMQNDVGLSFHKRANEKQVSKCKSTKQK